MMALLTEIRNESNLFIISLSFDDVLPGCLNVKGADGNTGKSYFMP